VLGADFGVNAASSTSCAKSGGRKTAMAIERTLCIIKPDAVEKRKSGAILQHLLEEGFDVLALRQQQLSQHEAEGFYAVHRERPFFKDLCEFMTRGPVVLIALQRDNAVLHWRKVIGATDPAKAEAGTIRKLYGSSLGENAVHGSDSVENGRIECAYYFSGSELG
jgi:nucleoside-diphosphate kinase